MSVKGFYQPHSETSQISAQLRDTKLVERIHSLFIKQDIHGLTGREIAIALRIAPGTASARLVELRKMGIIKKSKEKRHHKIGSKTVPSSVWKLSKYVDSEGDSKRDKIAEIKDVIHKYSGNNTISLDTFSLIRDLNKVLN